MPGLTGHFCFGNLMLGLLKCDQVLAIYKDKLKNCAQKGSDSERTCLINQATNALTPSVSIVHWGRSHGEDVASLNRINVPARYDFPSLCDFANRFLQRRDYVH